MWFLFKLVPCRWMYNKEDKEKVPGEKSEKNEREISASRDRHFFGEKTSSQQAICEINSLERKN